MSVLQPNGRQITVHQSRVHQGCGLWRDGRSGRWRTWCGCGHLSHLITQLHDHWAAVTWHTASACSSGRTIIRRFVKHSHATDDPTLVLREYTQDSGGVALNLCQDSGSKGQQTESSGSVDKFWQLCRPRAQELFFIFF